MSRMSRRVLDQRLNGKYLKEAEDLLVEKDYPQASEKLWGAAVEIVKAVAASRGEPLGAHKSVGRFIVKLHREHPEWRLQETYGLAETLHINFYEDNLPEELVEMRAEAVRGFIERLRELL